MCRMTGRPLLLLKVPNLLQRVRRPIGGDIQRFATLNSKERWENPSVSPDGKESVLATTEYRLLGFNGQRIKAGPGEVKNLKEHPGFASDRAAVMPDMIHIKLIADELGFRVADPDVFEQRNDGKGRNQRQRQSEEKTVPDHD